MERERNKQVSLLLLTLVAGLLSQNLLVPVMSITSVDDQKNYYYSPDPHAGSPPTPTSSHGSPPHGYGGTPPYHGTPSHGGGGSHGTPPSNCGTPPSGGHHTPTPSPPTGGSSYSPPTYSYSPPTYSTPPTPFVGTPPSTGTPPVTLTPPTIDPGVPTTPTPGISFPTPPFAFPTPPFAFDPNSPPFSCNYWRTHPTLIWGVLGFWGTMGSTLGATSVPGFGSSMSLQQALSNSRADGFGALYREGTASFLNSMVDRRFPFTTQQVRDNFVGAIGSNKAAGAQARVFKLANEGRLKPRN
ncbi:hypothetical protein RHGRI_017308 [Rhododendron griersonianum]|uniref:Protodermal factor 1 n=1 Tax=Rhododendron griersonianum TaxID=479676 RepID=A0AAV6JXC9_9ERIC|nr:hypothetical protein RHGRI_017308 [Rhododendron griersonianum]